MKPCKVRPVSRIGGMKEDFCGPFDFEQKAQDPDDEE